MILPTTAFAVWIVAIASLLCLGSWANTLKLAGKWRFEYYYYDFVFGVLLSAGLAALLLGSGRSQDLTFQDNLLLTGYRKMAWAMGAGVMLNLGMLLLLASMTIAGMTVAFGLTVGVAMVIGSVWDFADTTQANTTMWIMGVVVLAAGVVTTGISHLRRLRVEREAAQKALTPDPRAKTKRAKPPGSTLLFVLSAVGGIALGTFPRILGEATSGVDNPLGPYAAVLFLAASAVISSPFFVLFFTTFPVTVVAGSPQSYLAGNKSQHLLGVAGGILWSAGMLTSLMAAGAPQIAQPGALVQYALSNGALVIAAIWGLFAWREFRAAGDRARMLAMGMVVLFLIGLGMVAFALAPK